MNQKESIMGILESMEKETVINLWNKYCERYNPDGFIMENEEYWLTLMFSDVMSALRASQYGDYRITDRYFRLDGNGNLESFGITDAMDYIDLDYLVGFIINNGCDEIGEVWYEDMISDFIEFYNSKYPTLPLDFYNDEDWDFIEPYDLICDDWGYIADEIFDTKKGEE